MAFRWLTRLFAKITGRGKAGPKSAEPKRARGTMATPEQFRRATKAELKKLGVSEKTTRYIAVDTKRVTKRTPTISRRQFENVKRGGLTSTESKRFSVPGKSRVFSEKEGGFTEYYYKMPPEEAAFNTVLARLREMHPSHNRMVTVSPIANYGNMELTGRRMLLSEFRYGDAVEGAEELQKQYRGRHPGALRSITLKVRVYPERGAG